MMTTELQQARDRLLARQRELLDRLAQLRDGAASRAEASVRHFGHPEDSRAQVDREKSMELALDAHERAELAAIAAALARIAEGRYGECVDCGAAIAAARLAAAPEALRCLACQDAAEHRAAA